MKTLVAISFIFSSLFCFSQEPKLVLPIGHTNGISNVVYSPDGKFIATSSQDQTIKLWDAKDGALLADMKEHSCGRNTIIFSDDSRLYLTYSAKKDLCWGDSFVIVWDAKTTHEIFRLAGHRLSILSAVFSPDGKTIATASADSTIGLWNATNGKLLHSVKAHRGEVNSVMFSKDGMRLVTASADGSVITWSVPQLKQEQVIASGFTDGVSFAAFSPDGQKIVLAGLNDHADDNFFTLHDSRTGKLLDTLGINFDMSMTNPSTAAFSKDGNYILLSTITSEVWELRTKKKVFPKEAMPDYGDPQRADYFKKYSNNMACPGKLSTSGRLLCLLGWRTDTAYVYNYVTGHLLQSFSVRNTTFGSVTFNPEGSKLVGAMSNESVVVWNIEAGLPETEIKGHTVKTDAVYSSPGGSTILTTGYEQVAKLWDANTGRLLLNFRNENSNFAFVEFSPDGSMLATLRSTISFNNLPDDRVAMVWDLKTGKRIATLTGHTNVVNHVAFSADGEQIVTASDDNTAIVWEARTGKKLFFLRGHEDGVEHAAFSGSGSSQTGRIATVSSDGTLKIWNAPNGELVFSIKAHDGKIESVYFNAPGDKVVTTSADRTFKVWDTRKGTLLFQNSPFVAGYYPYPVFFTPDAKGLLSQAVNGIRYFDAGTGQLVYHIKMDSTRPGELQLSKDGNYLLVKEFLNNRKIEFKNILRVYKVSTGQLVTTLQRTPAYMGLNAFALNTDASRVFVVENDNTCTVWSTATGEFLYNFFAVDSTDYLVVDAKKRYDGTVRARNLIYFTCETEIIQLDQVKDQLWVPNLVSRIVNKETINEPGITELNICNLMPLVEQDVKTPNQYRYFITPRRGGVGDVILSVNGIEVKRYQLNELVQEGNKYMLSVSPASIQSFLKTGENNRIQVRALVKGNTISSRGSELQVEEASTVTSPPQIFAVFIGVSDYKGTELDLQYAAKDAEDLGNAFAAAARKLLNTANGKEQVFIYRLHTGNNRSGFPDKNTIRQTFREIGKKAGPNDILFVFFAGHGVMQGDNKQFYLLTADASKTTALEAVSQVGISTSELTEWIKPGTINAQKRILIFDACNSGQAIRDFVKIGDNHQNYVAARSDEESQQIKAIEKLNERSGFFILSASASNQSAYELGLYAQGLLTYALLKTIKQSPDILEQGKYLDVSRWFNASRDVVNELVRQSGARQEPQLISTTNFTVGLVDDEVRNQIHLPQEKPVFSSSNLQNNDEAVAADDLELSKLVDKELQLYTGGTVDPVFIFQSQTGEAYLISGRYEVQGNQLIVKVNIRKNKEVKHRFEVSGAADNPKAVAEMIVRKAAAFVQTKD
jgi:WD40 repeat protein